MNNEIANELSHHRADRLSHLPSGAITDLVAKALGESTMQAFAGLDAEADGLTGVLWQQAVITAECQGELTFGQTHDADLSNAEPKTFDEVADMIANRVANAILTVHGMVDGSDDHITSGPGYANPLTGKTVWVLAGNNEVEVFSERPSGVLVSHVIWEASIDGGDAIYHGRGTVR